MVWYCWWNIADKLDNLLEEKSCFLFQGFCHFNTSFSIKNTTVHLFYFGWVKLGACMILKLLDEQILPWGSNALRKAGFLVSWASKWCRREMSSIRIARHNLWWLEFRRRNSLWTSKSNAGECHKMDYALSVISKPTNRNKQNWSIQ